MLPATLHEIPFLIREGGLMAIDPDLYEKVSGRRANDAAYGAAMLAAGKSNSKGMSTLEAAARGRKWMAIGFGVLVAVIVGYFLISGL